MRTSEII